MRCSRARAEAALLAFHAQRHLGAARHGAAADRELHAVLRRRRRRARSGREKAVARGEIAPGPTGAGCDPDGAISEAATGYVIAGKPELTPELADESSKPFSTDGNDSNRYENSLHFSCQLLALAASHRRSPCRVRTRWLRRSAQIRR